MYQEAKRKYLQQHGFRAFSPKAALIDMDGVLFDSMPHHASSWVQVMHSIGLSFDAKEAYQHEGRTGRGTIEIIFRRELHRDPTDQEVRDLYAMKAGLFDALPEAEVMPGAPETLEAIRLSGLTRVLVTGSGQKLLLGRIDRHFPGHFSEDRMVTAFDVKQGKPFPEPYLKGLQKAGVEASEAIVIENAPLGVQSAKAAGIFTVAVNTGLLEDSYLTDEGCDLLFHSMRELAAAWPEIVKPVQL